MDTTPVLIFIASCLAILPLAGLMGEATEQLAHRSGPGLGGLLNATFGNAAELIIGFMALRAGETEIVKASITGSILGNLLMVLGLAMLVGGWTRKELRFNRLAAESRQRHDAAGGRGARDPGDLRARHRAPQPGAHRVDQPRHLVRADRHLRGQPAVLVAYRIAGCVRHRGADGAGRDAPAHPGTGAAPRRGRSRGASSAWSLAAAAVGLVSEFLVGAVDQAGTALGLSKMFMGVIVIAVVGNAAEHSTAILVARKGQMDLALGIAMGSAMQIALFVAPVLVIAGHLIGQPMGLEFTMLEVSAVMLSVMAVSYLVLDGRTHWFEGVQLLAIYTILAMTFYFL